MCLIESGECLSQSECSYAEYMCGTAVKRHVVLWLFIYYVIISPPRLQYMFNVGWDDNKNLDLKLDWQKLIGLLNVFFFHHHHRTEV